jgi:hypothetical protein
LSEQVEFLFAMTDIPTHHHIYGTCRDYVTGEILPDTDDERYRQKLARLLVEQKGYRQGELEMRLKIETLFASQFVTSRVDITVGLAGKRVMIVRYGPGSLVTRERAAIAAARVLDAKQRIPLAVVTNGEEAELLDTFTGKVIREGLAEIPSRGELLSLLPQLDFSPQPADRREKELRILNAFDVEACCAGSPCPLPKAPEG